jgi:phospholipid/cholesterol/gamma-HCH transport system substrate-binding protein
MVGLAAFHYGTTIAGGRTAPRLAEGTSPEYDRHARSLAAGEPCGATGWGLRSLDAGALKAPLTMQKRSIAEILTGLVVLAIAASFLGYAVTSTGRSFSGPGMNLTAKFDRIDGLGQGADVRIAGVKVGQVVAQRIDPESFLAVLTLRVDAGLKLPHDTSAEISSEGLLGGKYVALVPGGDTRILREGSEITITQSAINLESLLGRFIFSAGESNQRGNQEDAPATPR